MWKQIEYPIANKTMELTEAADQWMLDEKHHCWCLEDVLYTQKADVPKFQRLSVFVPEAFMKSPGQIDPEAVVNGFTAATVPVVFENNSAGYMQMPHTWLEGPRCYAQQYLEHGLVYVTCGCRGRESRNRDGKLVGKAPISLVDLKTAIRFLRHNKAALPGDFDRIISVGWSAGGAMSSLLAVSGDHPAFQSYLEQNGAFLEESDAVYAAQIYCPIIDLEHADQAYEWMFHADKDCEDSPAGPAEHMSAFKEALSSQLSEQYIAYINALALKDPESGEPLTFGEDGRSGSFYEYLMKHLTASASAFLTRLEQGKLDVSYSVQDYLKGNYTYEAPAPVPKDGPPAGGPPVGGPPKGDPQGMSGEMFPGPELGMPLGPKPGMLPGPKPGMPSLGDLVSRPPKGIPFIDHMPPMIQKKGAAKPWLSWDGCSAGIPDLDTYVLEHRRRMKPCTSFDKLEMDSGENQVFGNEEQDYVHFNPQIGEALAAIAAQFPQEAAKYRSDFETCMNEALARRIALLNPLHYIGKEEGKKADYFRIRTGAFDADTALSVSLLLAVRLANAGAADVDYALVWDQPHSEADYPGEILAWIDRICR